MAGFNEILEPGLNNSLGKRLGMQSGSPSPTLTPEIFPVISVGVAWEELAFNQGWRRWQRTQTQAAVAGQSARFQLVNRAAGVLVVVEEIIIVGSAGGVYAGDWGYANSAALATLSPANTEARDTRQAPSAGSALEMSAGTAAALLTAQAFRITASSSELRVPGAPWLLWGGGTLLIGSYDANAERTINVVWSERGMQRSEQLG